MSNRTPLEELIPRFEPITLAEMDRVKLQARVDTKFVFAERDLPGMLNELMPHYRLLEVNGKRGADYRSLYFDTADKAHFLAHHNGRVFRSKVRFREYVGSDLIFLEAKRKTGRGDTDKVRMRVSSIPSALSAEQAAFIQQAIRSPEQLEPVLWNDFTRYTFVHRTREERLTIDLALRFTTGERRADLGGICIAELKESRADRGSPFTAMMRARGYRPAGMSKYCVGLLLLGLAPKANAFKPVLLRLEHLRRAA